FINSEKLTTEQMREKLLELKNKLRSLRPGAKSEKDLLYIKIKEIGDIIAYVSGVKLELNAKKKYYTPNDSLGLNFKYYERIPIPNARKELISVKNKRKREDGHLIYTKFNDSSYEQDLTIQQPFYFNITNQSWLGMET